MIDELKRSSSRRHAANARGREKKAPSSLFVVKGKGTYSEGIDSSSAAGDRKKSSTIKLLPLHERRRKERGTEENHFVNA